MAQTGAEAGNLIGTGLMIIETPGAKRFTGAKIETRKTGARQRGNAMIAGTVEREVGIGIGVKRGAEKTVEIAARAREAGREAGLLMAAVRTNTAAVRIARVIVILSLIHISEPTRPY